MGAQGTLASRGHAPESDVAQLVGVRSGRQDDSEHVLTLHV
jgi:hypothetical protein